MTSSIPTRTASIRFKQFRSIDITPENGPSAHYDGTIPKPVTGNTSVASVEVKIPLDTVCHVHVWTR